MNIFPMVVILLCIVAMALVYRDGLKKVQKENESCG